MTPRQKLFLFTFFALLATAGCGGDSDARSAPESPTAVREAAFVGSEACASCHQDVALQYAETAKHGSISHFDPTSAPEALPGPEVYNAATDLHYQAFLRGDTLFQREFRLAEDGTVLHEVAWPAAYVIGSGAATRSYLMRVNGYVTEMPLTWYAEDRRWDMSPGYEDANDRFARKISLECATCHTDFPEHSAYTQNHYPPGLPTGIGCERCHGPGGDHVALRSAGEGPPPGQADPTIVHPGRLDRDRQLSICQQCHLAGVNVYREGESPTTFRPGQSLWENRTVFVPEQQLTDPEWVGIDSHPLRLARSACYQASEMTCTTCHAPHTAGSQLSDADYDATCAGCHAVEGHPGPEPPASGDCVDCHMSRGGTSDVPHVRFTDHWIRRDPGPALDPSQGRPAFDSPEPIRLVALQQAGRSAHILEERGTSTPLDALETAAAYMTFYETMHRVPAYRSTIVEAARRGLEGGADHVEARIALGRALADIGSLAEAEQVFLEATRAYPDDPWSHFWLGSIRQEQGRTDAVEPLRRSVDLQPYLIEAQVKLADALYGTGRTREALDQLRRVVELDPVHAPRAWYNMAVLLLGGGEAEAAEAALTRAVSSDPDLTDAQVLLGSRHLDAGRLDDAERHFLAAVAADAGSVAGYGSLALVHIRRGDTNAARAALERALEIDPTNADVRRLLDQLGGAGSGR